MIDTPAPLAVPSSTADHGRVRLRHHPRDERLVGAGHHAHSHDAASHDHDRAHPVETALPPRRRVSLVCMSLAERCAVALVLSGLIWAGVVWAMRPIAG